MEVTERFAALVRGPETDLRLDEAGLLMAAHRYPELDVDAQMARIDGLADACGGSTLDHLRAHLFGVLGFAGDTEHYDDERNSFLNDVVERRRGLPISLSVLTVEVGRRIGAPLAPVALPGHVIVRDRVDPGVFVDPFHGGRLLDATGVDELVRLHGGVGASPVDLAPAAPRAILVRMLTNLEVRYRAAGRAADLVWVQRLLGFVPGVSIERRRQLAVTLTGLGRFDEAAAVLEALAELSGGADAVGLRHRARAVRARLN